MVKIHIRDAEHWITVHPNGAEKGTPLLIEGSNGHYTVKGGAGGKLNGKEISPKSMSKSKAGGSEGEGSKEKPKSEAQKSPKAKKSVSHSKTANGMNVIHIEGEAPYYMGSDFKKEAALLTEHLKKSDDPVSDLEKWRKKLAEHTSAVMFHGKKYKGEHPIEEIKRGLASPSSEAPKAEAQAKPEGFNMKRPSMETPITTEENKLWNSYAEGKTILNSKSKSKEEKAAIEAHLRRTEEKLKQYQSERESPKAEPRKFDHGELNVPLNKRGDINAKIDKYLAEQEKLKREKAKQKSAENKSDKAVAKELLSSRGDELIAHFGAKYGEKKIKEVLADWSKWQPKKLIEFVEKFDKEQASKK